MPDWYASSVAHAAVPQFAINTAYTVGQFVRALAAPAAGRAYVHRCTTAGLSGATEPAWSSTNNTTTTSNTAVFTNVTGQAAYGWSAAAGDLYTLSSAVSARPAVGDRVFVSKDNVDNALGNTYAITTATSAFGLVQVISVNRAGAVPPVEADVQAGAAINFAASSVTFIEAYCNMFWQGITFTQGATQGNVNLNSGGLKNHYFKDCAFVLNSATASRLTANDPSKVTLDNTPVTFGSANQQIMTGASANYGFDWTWINTPNAVKGTVPAFGLVSSAGISNAPAMICRGVDLSAVTATLVGVSGGAASFTKLLLDSCKIAPNVTRLGTQAAASSPNDIIELVNCYDGTNILNERHTAAGSIVTDRGIYLTDGAQDDVSAYSLKMASSSRADFAVMALNSFGIDVENALTGSPKTATVEIVSSQSLNNNDIRLLLEYMGASGSPVANFVDSLVTVLTPAAALPSSSAAWTGPTYDRWNALDLSGITLSNNNLTVTNSVVSAGVRANVGLSSGKYYFEVTVTSASSAAIGLALSTAAIASGSLTLTGTVTTNTAGQTQVNGTTGISIVSINGSRVDIAVDLTNSLIWFRNATTGLWNGNVANNPATGVGGINISAVAGTLFPYFGTISLINQTVTANFGTSAFAGSVPSGFTSGWPGMPSIKQKLQVNFTPQRVGRLRGLVRLGRPSTTVWANPQMLVT